MTSTEYTLHATVEVASKFDEFGQTLKKVPFMLLIRISTERIHNSEFLLNMNLSLSTEECKFHNVHTFLGNLFHEIYLAIY